MSWFFDPSLSHQSPQFKRTSSFPKFHLPPPPFWASSFNVFHQYYALLSLWSWYGFIPWVPVRLNNRKQISEWCYHIFYIICSLNFFATFQQNFCCYKDHHKHWYNNSKNIHYKPVWVHCYLIWWHPEMKIKYKDWSLTIDSFTFAFYSYPLQ